MNQHTTDQALIEAFANRGAQLVLEADDEGVTLYDVRIAGVSVEGVGWNDGMAMWGRDRMNMAWIDSASKVADRVLGYARARLA